MSQDRKLPNELTTEFVERLAQNFLEDGDLLFHILNNEAPITEITLLGTVINITLKRVPYISAAGDILEKGKVIVNNLKKTETYLRGGTLAELQSVESNVQDDKVVEEKSEQGEGELTKERSEEIQAKISREASEVIEIKEQKVGAWWDSVRDHWLWSGCVVSTKWEDFTQDEKDYVIELWDGFREVVQ